MKASQIGSQYSTQIRDQESLTMAGVAESRSDHDGRYADFHSCRHLFITSLERAGISPKMAQTLARHSDIRLTLQICTHVELHDQTAAIRAPAGPGDDTILTTTWSSFSVECLMTDTASASMPRLRSSYS